MKKLILLSLFIYSLHLYAQSTSMQSEFVKQRQQAFAKFKNERVCAYEIFITERNKAYAEFLAQRWGEYQKEKGEEPLVKPLPLGPIIKEDIDIKAPPIKLPIKELVIIPPMRPMAPTFVSPIKEEPKAEFNFTFIGTKISVGLTDKHRFALSSTLEQDVANMWQTLSDGRMVDIINDCLYWKDKMQLNDYFYVLMLDSMCDSFFGSSKANESRLMKTYIMTQSGYDAKCGRKNDSLIVLLAIEETIYRTTYLIVDGRKYYIIDEPQGGENKYYTFAQKFSDDSKNCSMRIESEIVHPHNVNTTKILVSERYPSLKVETTIDKNLIDAYNNYPRCRWDVYAKAPMSSNLAGVVYPKIKSEIAGKSEVEAANIILNFVQTAFEYKTDEEFFGYERSLFVDETFYYPYSDCEDRSILYANLMRNILGLDVVLLYYPNHLATAVKFKGNYTGDYMMINNEKYIICDPTYICANIGEAMPACKGVSAEVVIL